MKPNGMPKNQSQDNNRALIFQGGGALGAYEAGIFKALYDRFINEAENEDRQLFDIVAGTSAGAINATLLTNHVIKNKTWRGSADILYQFWDDVSTSTWWLENPFLGQWRDLGSFLRESSSENWKAIFEIFDPNNLREKWPLIFGYYLWPDKYGGLATNEAARRYWSWYQFAYTQLGTPNVLLPAITQPDFKFFNPLNYMLRYDNTPIIETIRKYWNDEVYPIKTDENQPRLLLVASDMQDSTTVTFDSYKKIGDKMMSVYGDDDKVTHEIHYDDGIRMDHLLTTMSSHLRYKFPELDVITTENCVRREEKRQFWDGIYLSNTPLREVLQAHRDYWHDVRKRKEDIPSLDIYIGDLYPTIEKGVPEDPDSIQNRVQDVLYHDKSKYDEKVARIVSDYISINRGLIKLAKDKGASDLDIDVILNSIDIKSNKRTGKRRSAKDLLEGRFTIKHIKRIEYGSQLENTRDHDDIYGKAFEFSSRTINGLRVQGYRDTMKIVK